MLQLAALMTNIKSHDHLRLADLGNKEIIQVDLPFPMPKRSIASPYYYTFLSVDELRERYKEKKTVKSSPRSPPTKRHGGRKRKRKEGTEEDEAEEELDGEDGPAYNMQEDAGVHEEVFEDLLELDHNEDDINSIIIEERKQAEGEKQADT